MISYAWLLLDSDRTLIRSEAFYICSYISFIFASSCETSASREIQVLFKVLISVVFYKMSRSVVAEMSS